MSTATRFSAGCHHLFQGDRASVAGNPQVLASTVSFENYIKSLVQAGELTLSDDVRAFRFEDGHGHTQPRYQQFLRISGAIGAGKVPLHRDSIGRPTKTPYTEAEIASAMIVSYGRLQPMTPAQQVVGAAACDITLAAFQSNLSKLVSKLGPNSKLTAATLTARIAAMRSSALLSADASAQLHITIETEREQKAEAEAEAASNERALEKIELH